MRHARHGVCPKAAPRLPRGAVESRSASHDPCQGGSLCRVEPAAWHGASWPKPARRADRHAGAVLAVSRHTHARSYRVPQLFRSPNLVDTGLVGPSLGGPSLGGPSLGGPSLGGPSLVGPRLVDTGLVDPGLVDNGVVEHGAAGRGGATAATDARRRRHVRHAARPCRGQARRPASRAATCRAAGGKTGGPCRRTATGRIGRRARYSHSGGICGRAPRHIAGARTRRRGDRAATGTRGTGAAGA